MDAGRVRSTPARVARGKQSEERELLTNEGSVNTRPPGTGDARHARYSSAEGAEGRTIPDTPDTADSFAKKRTEKRPPPLETGSGDLELSELLRAQSAASEEQALMSPLGQVVMSKTEFKHGARRQHLEEGLRSPGTRRAAQKMQRTHSWDGESDVSSMGEDDPDGVRSLMPQLARHASLASHGGLLDSPIVPNAEYSEDLTAVRQSAQAGLGLTSTASRDQKSGTHSHAHLPEGIQGVQIHGDVYIAPHKLQHAIYEARRQFKLFNDKLLPKQPESPKAADPLDKRAHARMSKYSDMWTRNDKIPPFYKDAERKALDLITQLNGNSSGTVPPAPLHERPKILAQLGSMKAIKGHPVVKNTVLKCCKSKEWQERLKAVQCIPFLFYKGDPDAIGVLFGRLLDWHLEVRRASVQVLLDSAANLTVTVMSGRDLAQPEAAVAMERMRKEADAAAAAAASGINFARAPSGAGINRQPSSGFSRVPSHTSASGSRPGTRGLGSSLMQSVAAFNRLSSNTSRKSSVVSRAASTATSRRPVEMPEITIHVVCRFEDSEEDADTQARTISLPCDRRPKFRGGGEVLRLQVKDPEQAKLVIELIAHINGGGPPDERCTFCGTASQKDESGKAGSDVMSVGPGTESRPSTQERTLNQVFNRASSAASMAQKLQEPFKITGPLPASTVVLGRAEEKLTDIANQIIHSEQWIQLTDGHGKPAGSILMKLALEPAKGIGCSATMGREMSSLVAPALLDADSVMRSRALRLYQMCVSAGWERARKRQLAREQQREATQKRRSKYAEHLALMRDRESLLNFNQNPPRANSTDDQDSDDEFRRACSAGDKSEVDIQVRTSTPGSKHDFEVIKTPMSAVQSAVNVMENEGGHPNAQIKEVDSGITSPTMVGRWQQEESEGLGKLQSPYFPGTNALRMDAGVNSTHPGGLIPFGANSYHRNFDDDLITVTGIQVEAPGDGSVQKLEEEERLRLAAEHEAEKRMEFEEEEESALEDKELDVLLEALLGGLCDPESGVRWTAVELMRVVLKREDDRGSSKYGTRVLDVAVPLARLSDDEDTRVAAINVIYYAGRSCRGWTAHHSVTNLPEELRHHNSEAEHGDSEQDHHYLHHHEEMEDDNDIEGWTLRDVLEDRLDDRNWMARRAATLAYSNLADKGDLDAIHNVLPLLSDEVYSVRCAALQAIENITGSPFLKANEKPTELQLQIVKAILDRVVTVPTPETDPWLNPDLEQVHDSDANEHSIGFSESEHQQFQTELGARMALLFSLGCMEFSGWQSMEHQKWSHMQEWVLGAWKEVCADKESAQRAREEKERKLQNKYTQAALAAMQAEEEAADEESRRRKSEIHIRALEYAANQAATKMQARWRGIKGREKAHRKQTELFVRLESADQEKRTEEDRISKLSSVQKLEEYIERRDLMSMSSASPVSPGRGRSEVILPNPQDFGFHSHTGRSGSRGRSRSRGNTPTTLPPAPGASFRLRVSNVNDQDDDEDSEHGEATVLPALGRSQQHIWREITGTQSPSKDANASVGGHIGWDPLGRKRSMSPPKKPTLEEQEKESAKKFLEWEEKERRRKEQEEQARKEREKAARRRTLKTIRTETPSPGVKTMQQPHKIKSTWKCGGVKISEVVKKMYKAESSEVGESRPESRGGDGLETADAQVSHNWLPNSQGMNSKEGFASNAVTEVLEEQQEHDRLRKAREKRDAGGLNISLRGVVEEELEKVNLHTISAQKQEKILSPTEAKISGKATAIRTRTKEALKGKGAVAALHRGLHLPEDLEEKDMHLPHLAGSSAIKSFGEEEETENIH